MAMRCLCCAVVFPPPPLPAVVVSVGLCPASCCLVPWYVLLCVLRFAWYCVVLCLPTFGRLLSGAVFGGAVSFGFVRCTLCCAIWCGAAPRCCALCVVLWLRWARVHAPCDGRGVVVRPVALFLLCRFDVPCCTPCCFLRCSTLPSAVLRAYFVCVVLRRGVS